MLLVLSVKVSKKVYEFKKYRNFQIFSETFNCSVSLIYKLVRTFASSGNFIISVLIKLFNQNLSTLLGKGAIYMLYMQ